MTFILKCITALKTDYKRQRIKCDHETKRKGKEHMEKNTQMKIKEIFVVQICITKQGDNQQPGKLKRIQRNKETTQRQNNSKALKDKHTDLLLTTQFEANDKWK